MLSPNGSTFCPNGHSESWRSWIPLLHTSPTTTSPTREKPLWKLSSFHLGLFATEPHYLIKKPSAFSWHCSRPVSPVHRIYTAEWMDAYSVHAWIWRIMQYAHPGKKPKKKTKKENAKRERKSPRGFCIDAVHHYAFIPALCVPFCWGLIVLGDIAVGYTPY